MEISSTHEALAVLGGQFADHNAVGSRSYAAFVAIGATPDFDTPARQAAGAVGEFLQAM